MNLFAASGSGTQQLEDQILLLDARDVFEALRFGKFEQFRGRHPLQILHADDFRWFRWRAAGGAAVLVVVRHLRCRRSEEHTSELQSLMRSSYAVFCLKTK